MRSGAIRGCLIGLLLAGASGGCSEEPQSLPEARAPGFETDGWSEQMRERARRQNEYARIEQNR